MVGGSYNLGTMFDFCSRRPERRELKTKLYAIGNRDKKIVAQVLLQLFMHIIP
jgi:hypothetical protein